MKKAMLFVVAFLFSLNAQAASLTLSGFDTYGDVDQAVTVDTGKTVLAHGTVTKAGEWDSLFILTTDTDTTAKITWSFNDETDLDKATVVFGELFFVPDVEQVISGDFSFTVLLLAGVEYAVDIVGANSLDVMSYDLSVKAVPVPAAVFLFAPALLGLFGLRRKSPVATA